ncbi:50S ribosomal protein L32 [Candidatus Annandia pinicola]|uniref:50S ribosomal protein L32 n=1 Tax=Candidatus Annandia pinicola TaxID=1345117 RepID=UPI001D00D8F1|nr:50S ribosomal protein L32 [Candidatus Annandia pinicola]UDG80395.1 50S ribosomal protein L32 [Candidatus Annandia pinicola]
MAVPKKKISRSKKKIKRLNYKLKHSNISTDSNSGEQHLYHNITKSGFYKGVKYFNRFRYK